MIFVVNKNRIYQTMGFNEVKEETMKQVSNRLIRIYLMLFNIDIVYEGTI